MNVEIIDKPFSIIAYGFSSVASDKDYAKTAFKLSGKMWDTVKTNNLKNKGINIWVYEPNDMVFAGVELEYITTIRLKNKKYNSCKIRLLQAYRSL